MIDTQAAERAETSLSWASFPSKVGSSPEDGETYTSRGLWGASFLVPGAAEPVSCDELGDPVAGGNTGGIKAVSGYGVILQITMVSLRTNSKDTSCCGSASL